MNVQVFLQCADLESLVYTGAVQLVNFAEHVIVIENVSPFHSVSSITCCPSTHMLHILSRSSQMFYFMLFFSLCFDLCIPVFKLADPPAVHCQDSQSRAHTCSALDLLIFFLNLVHTGGEPNRAGFVSVQIVLDFCHFLWTHASKFHPSSNITYLLLNVLFFHQNPLHFTIVV